MKDFHVRSVKNVKEEYEINRWTDGITFSLENTPNMNVSKAAIQYQQIGSARCVE